MADEIGIDWMDGMPLTIKQISSFIDLPENQLKILLDDLAKRIFKIRTSQKN